MIKRILFLCLLIISFILSGCGGGGGNSVSPAVPSISDSGSSSNPAGTTNEPENTQQDGSLKFMIKWPAGKETANGQPFSITQNADTIEAKVIPDDTQSIKIELFKQGTETKIADDVILNRAPGQETVETTVEKLPIGWATIKGYAYDGVNATGNLLTEGLVDVDVLSGQNSGNLHLNAFNIEWLAPDPDNPLGTSYNNPFIKNAYGDMYYTGSVDIQYKYLDTYLLEGEVRPDCSCKIEIIERGWSETITRDDLTVWLIDDVNMIWEVYFPGVLMKPGKNTIKITVYDKNNNQCSVTMNTFYYKVKTYFSGEMYYLVERYHEYPAEDMTSYNWQDSGKIWLDDISFGASFQRCRWSFDLNNIWSFWYRFSLVALKNSWKNKNFNCTMKANLYLGSGKWAYLCEYVSKDDPFVFPKVSTFPSLIYQYIGIPNCPELNFSPQNKPDGDLLTALDWSINDDVNGAGYIAFTKNTTTDITDKFTSILNDSSTNNYCIAGRIKPDLPATATNVMKTYWPLCWFTYPPGWPEPGSYEMQWSSECIVNEGDTEFYIEFYE